jgi:hypothetical protein
VQESKDYFHQCTRCGKWVCPEVCWNSKADLCEGCAPDLDEEMAAGKAQAMAQAAQEQLHEKARKTDYVKEVDMSPGGKAENKPLVCPNCGERIQGGKFCASCGQAIQQERFCPECGNKVGGNSKFCAGCGTKMP